MENKSTSQTSDPTAMYKAAVAPIQLPHGLLSARSAAEQRVSWREVAGSRGMLVERLLDPAEVQRIKERLEGWQPVGLDGIADNYQDGDPIGSYRLTSDAADLAKGMWQRLMNVVPHQVWADGGDRHHPALDLPEGDQRRWTPCGLNPRLRFIRYLEGGMLIPHYDGPFIAREGEERSLMTVVIYLGKEGDAAGGATRFIKDGQEGLPLDQMDLSDWKRMPEPSEVIARIDPPAGSALLFWHRTLHDSEPIRGSGDKTIIRTDVMFKPRKR